jgi:hypothetical protein
MRYALGMRCNVRGELRSNDDREQAEKIVREGWAPHPSVVGALCRKGTTWPAASRSGAGLGSDESNHRRQEEDWLTRSTCSAPHGCRCLWQNGQMAVSPQCHDLYEQWRLADARARAAEQEVAARLLHAIDRRQQPPDVDAWEESKQLQRHAEKLLRAFIAAVQVERVHVRQQPTARETDGGGDPRNP